MAGLHNQFYRSILKRLSLVEAANLTYDKFKFGLLLLFRIVFLPFYVRIVANRHIPVLVDPFGSNSQGLENRLSFMKVKFGEESFHIVSGKYILCDLRNVWKLPLIWIISFVFAIYILFCVKRNYVRSCWSVTSVVSSVVLLKNENIYFWRLYSISSYLGAYYARSRAIVIATDAFLWKWRYTYLPEATLILRSRHQAYEFDGLSRTIWFRFKEVDKDFSWLSNVSGDFKPHIQFGLYSSGWWARRDGFTRSPLNCITKNGFRNTYADRFDFIVSKFVKHGIESALYLHPYEQILHKKKSFQPPYMVRYGYSPIDINFNYASKNDFNKVEIGVSLRSTVIVDRWNLGLDGIMVIDEIEDKEIINKSILGKYQSKIIEVANFEAYLLAVTHSA